jgi:hypothetical protein
LITYACQHLSAGNGDLIGGSSSSWLLQTANPLPPLRGPFLVLAIGPATS